MRKYPKTAAACKEHADAQWKIGMALIKECGWPPAGSIHDDSREEMERVSAELLVEDGLEYDAVTLARYRTVAASYARDARAQEPEITQGVSFGGHQSAGDPDTLKKIVKKLSKEKKSFSVGNIREARRELEGMPAKRPDLAEIHDDPPSIRGIEMVRDAMRIADSIAAFRKNLKISGIKQVQRDAAVEQLARAKDELIEAEAIISGAKGDHLAKFMSERNKA